MPTNNAIDPFQCHPNWEGNACVDNFMQFRELGTLLLRSGDELVACTLRDSALLDVHVYSICYLYRQTLELLLKDLVWMSHYALTGEKRFAQPSKEWRELGAHKLTPLWRSALENSKKLLDADFPLERSEVDWMASLLARFETHDPESFSWRYPIGKNRTRNHSDVTNVNVAVLANSMDHFAELLGRVSERTAYHLEQVSEMREGS